MEDYFNGKSTLTREQENAFLESHHVKNTGTLAEKYISNLLTQHNISFVKHKRIVIGTLTLIPDFYLKDYDMFLEIKSRSYHCRGTASEKMDYIPRKYSILKKNVLVVCCAHELKVKSTLELLYPTTPYAKEFLKLAASFHCIGWISVENLIETLDTLKPKIKPFIKWVGGKTKLRDTIVSHFPPNFHCYYEPFLGGGAIALSLPPDIPKVLSDINPHLMNCYRQIQSNVDGLISTLNDSSFVNSKDCFLKKRAEFNRSPSPALFMYLNKCCFNGMYRENSKGEFNVPFGKMSFSQLYDAPLLKNVSQFLQNVSLKTCSFQDIHPQKHDFVYLDPPYHKTFTGYTQSNFLETHQLALKQQIDIWTSQGVYVLMSNSNTDFIKQLYTNYHIITLDTTYSVGGKHTSRQELLIRNFEISQ